MIKDTMRHVYDCPYCLGLINLVVGLTMAVVLGP